MGAADRAEASFSEGFNCSQAVFSAFAEELGMDEAAALGVSSAFGAGMGRMQLTCGAVTGAFMALGLARGHRTAGDAASRERSYSLVKEFNRRFIAAHGGTGCAGLLGVDLNTDEGARAFGAEGLKAGVCMPCVRSAAALVEELLAGGGA